VAHSGSHSPKFSFGPTEPNGGSHWGTERRFGMGREDKDRWLEYYIYFPDGTEGVGSSRYEHSSAAGSSHNNKFLSLWADSYQSEPLAIFQLWRDGTSNDSDIDVAITYGNRDGDKDLV